MKSSVVSLARATVLYGLGEVLARVMTLLLLPVFTAYLSPQDYGVISILSALGLLLIPVFSLGLGAAIAPVYFDGNSRKTKDATICATGFILAASVTLLLGAGRASAGLISATLLGTTAYSSLVVIALVTTAFTILTIPFRQYLQFEERARVYVVLSTISILTTTILSVVLVVVFKRGVYGMLMAGLVGQATGFCLFLSAQPSRTFAFHSIERQPGT